MGGGHAVEANSRLGAGCRGSWRGAFAQGERERGRILWVAAHTVGGRWACAIWGHRGSWLLFYDVQRS